MERGEGRVDGQSDTRARSQFVFVLMLRVTQAVKMRNAMLSLCVLELRMSIKQSPTF